jgi:hypothetical protein
MAAVTRIDDYQSYWRNIATPDYNHFLRNDDDLRSAFHCAISLFHMHDWVYRAHRTQIEATFTYLDQHKRPQIVRDASNFANSISDAYSDFELIRGVANSAKHLELSPRRTKRSPPPRNPAAPTHAANSYFSLSTVTIFGYQLWETGEIMLQMPSGLDRPLSGIATRVGLSSVIDSRIY